MTSVRPATDESSAQDKADDFQKPIWPKGNVPFSSFRLEK